MNDKIALTLLVLVITAIALIALGAVASLPVIEDIGTTIGFMAAAAALVYFLLPSKVR